MMITFIDGGNTTCLQVSTVYRHHFWG